MPLPSRDCLHHAIPSWVDEKDKWFVTICCHPRGLNQLANPVTAAVYRGALAFYEARGLIRPTVSVLMPDHLHVVAQFDHRKGMARTISGLKQHLARHAGISWQKGFFDHRLRGEHEVAEKCRYVRNNPVRAGLCATPSDWPFTY
jgi:REP element-mobilizing transposase RayT